MELAINTSGRKKLVITKVLEKRSVKGQKGDFDVLDFLAKIEGEDTGTKYQVSYSALFESIKAETTIDCDVVVTEQKQIDPDGNPYRNRKITQIYQDGKPVKEQQGGKMWGKSPETVAMEIDSKFRDTALMQACGFGPVQNVTEVLKVADAFYAWLKGEAKPAIKAPEKPVVKESLKTEQSKPLLPAKESQKPAIDLSWLGVTMKAVNWKDATLKSWLKMQFKVDTTGTIEEILSRCDPNQINMLVNHLNTMAEGMKVK